MPGPISEDEIRRLALNGANLVPQQKIQDDKKGTEVKRIWNLFDQVFATLQEDITTPYRTAACNLLSTLAEKCAQSAESSFHDLLWGAPDFWAGAFGVFLDQHHALNVKPSRQLLTSLTSVLAKCQDHSVCENGKTRVLTKLGSCITTRSRDLPTRPAMQALAHWLSKRIISVEDLCELVGNAPENESKPEHAPVRHLLEVVLRWAPFEDFASSAGSLASLILQKTTQSSQVASPLAFGSQQEPLWAVIVYQTLSGVPQSLEIFNNYVFPEIFPYDKAGFIAFLEALGIHSILGRESGPEGSLPFSRSQCEEVLFCALSVGSKLGLVRVEDIDQQTESQPFKMFIDKNVLCIPDTLLGELLLRNSDTVRIAGLSMLATTTITTKPLSMGAMRALKNGLPLLHADSDAGLRSQLFSLIKHLVDRMKAATANLARPSSKAKNTKSKTRTGAAEAQRDPAKSSELLRAHQTFLQWYVLFLKTELRPTASYQRHVSALKCIAIISRSGIDPQVPAQYHSKSAGPVVAWPFKIDVVDSEMTDLLIDLLLDPFDDVRSTSAEVLSLVETGTSQINDPSSTPVLVKVLGQAEDMMKLSGRADQADGVAHLYSILFSQCPNLTVESGGWWASQRSILEHLVDTIERTLQVAMADIGKAVSKHPLHGLFISLRYIIEKPGFYRTMASNPEGVTHLQVLYRRLHKLFQVVWSCVYGTLCNDAPEGFVPDELDEEDVGTKDILSYSWRALKESSLLLRTIVKSCPLVLADQPLLSSEQLRALGDLTFTELAELRHRGAFSTVAQTFIACCMRCNSGAETVSEVLEDWYRRAMLCIQNQTTINTRRSAGLPSLMIGIIVADSKGVLFNRAIKDLTAEATKLVSPAAEKAGGLSQVHAMNCIKDIFKNSKLGERSEAHVPEALTLAATCLSSDTWAVRNSGLMLFRALMDRVVGTNDSYADDDTLIQNRLSQEATTALMHVVLKLLVPADGNANRTNTEAVFPALQLLQRVQPPESMHKEVLYHVLRLAQNEQWHVRDKAARTYSILVPAGERILHAVNLIKEKGSQNKMHGFLLAARYLIERQGKHFNSGGANHIATAIQQRIDDLLYDNTCPFTQAAFVDVQTAFFWACVQKDIRPSTPDTHWAFVEEMNELLRLTGDRFTASSAFRQSLALSTIHGHSFLSENYHKNRPEPHEVASPSADQLIETFTDLAHRDPDACAAALQQAIKTYVDQRLVPQDQVDLLARISVKLLFDDRVTDVEVQDAAQEVLYRLTSDELLKADVVRDALRPHAQYLPLDTSTPLFSDKRLILQGILLSLRFSGASVPNRSLPADFAEWVLRVRSALHESNPFDTRIAATRALLQIDLKFEGFAVNEPEYSESWQQLRLAMYDAANDDDDEVRGLATEKSQLVPLAAGKKIAEHLALLFPASESLAAEAVKRITGGAVNAEEVKSVEELLEEKGKQNSSLFIQEKQNLFMDETREASIWSSVLCSLQRSAFSPALWRNLYAWAIEGLKVLIKEITKRPDTPLGWSRKPEVFVLGCQVLEAANVLLKLDEGVGRDVRGTLEEMAVKGKSNGVNVLWLRQVDEILGGENME